MQDLFIKIEIGSIFISWSENENRKNRSRRAYAT